MHLSKMTSPQTYLNHIRTKPGWLIGIEHDQFLALAALSEQKKHIQKQAKEKNIKSELLPKGGDLKFYLRKAFVFV